MKMTFQEVGAKLKFLLNIDPIKVENRMMSIICKHYFLDIIALNNIMITRGYNVEKHGNLKSFIIKTYGQLAVDLIETIINLDPLFEEVSHEKRKQISNR